MYAATLENEITCHACKLYTQTVLVHYELFLSIIYK